VSEPGLRRSRSLLLKFLFFAAVVCSVMAYRAGVFESVPIELATRGPYRFAYFEHRGAYAGIGDEIRRTAVELRVIDAEEAGIAAALYEDDPRRKPEAELRSKGGFLVSASYPVPPNVPVSTIEAREVLVARFFGDPRLSPYKVYLPMQTWMREHGYEVSGGSLEQYKSGFVEYELPVRRSDGRQ
jgi:hypothetical protein